MSSSPSEHASVHVGTRTSQRIAHLPVTLFSMVMGLAGWAIGWERLFPASSLAHEIASTIGSGASLLLVVLLCGYGWKLLRYPHEIRSELRHPVRLNFFPTLSISLLLLSVFWQPVPALALGLWSVGSALQLGLTLYVMSSWIHHGHFTLAHANPSWFIPVVGNIVVPLSGVYFGYLELSWFFFSIGLLFWLVLLTIVMYRLFFYEPLPQLLTPTLFILLAPPSVGFIAYTGLIGGLDNVARLLYYCALFLTMLLASNAMRFWRVPFFTSSWAFSFPLAALTIATMKMAVLSSQLWLTWLSCLLLMLLTIIMLWLIARTIQAVLLGKICVPE